MRRSRLIPAVLALVVLAYVVASARHLEAPGIRFVVDYPVLHATPRVVGPGWRLVPALLGRVARYPAAPATLRVDLSGRRAAASSEGARLEVEVDLTYEVPPGTLLDLHRTRGPGYATWLEDLTARQATARLRQVSYDVVRNRDPEFQRSLQTAVADEAGRDGVRVTRLRMVQIAAAGETSADILKAEARPLEREIVVIGVDSFDWRIIEPLMKAGRMPNMARLVARGARANLRTLRPILSPVIWTSIATGVKPSRHGIVDFVVAARDTGALLPVTSAMRQVPALWTILGRQGIDVSVIAWWATWPAETVRGRIVSDRVAFQLFQEQMQEDWKSGDPALARGKTYPPDLFETIRPLIKAPAEVTDDEVARFLPGGRFPPHPTPEEREQLNEFRTILAGGETYHAIARRLFTPGEPGLKMIYYEGPDTTSHLFMRDRPPLLPGTGREEMDLFGGIVDRYYEEQDRYLGEILERTGKDATVIVASDHGFKSGSDRPPHGDPRIGKGDAADWHTPVGVLVMAGPDIRPGADLGAASVLDVAPTVLALYGLPAARDMDGQPLTQALTTEFLARRPVAWVDTYGGFRPPAAEIAASAATPSAEDAALIEKLRNLGYIGEERMTARNNRGVIALDEGDVDGAIATLEQALESGQEEAGTIVRLNLARAWLQKGDLAKARGYAAAVLSADARSKQAESILAAVAMKEKDFDGAERRLRRAIAIDPAFVQAHAQLARLFEKRGRDAAALSEYRKLVEIAPLSPAEFDNMGNLYRKRGDTAKAIEAYREALRCDAQYIGAYNNLGLILQEEGKLEEAQALYEKALAIRPENPILRNSMGTLLALKGDPAGALAQFRRAADANPDWPVARSNIAELLYETGRYSEAKEAFERWVQLEPDSAEARLEYALSLLMVKNDDDAIVQFEEVVKRDPQEVRARIALGETLMRKGDLEKAQAQLEAAARIEGKIPRVYNSLAEVYLKRGLTREAAGAYRKSLALDPKQPAIRERLAEIAGGAASLSPKE